jgi:hypothetical protein
MSEEIIKDANGRTLGFIRTTPSGRQEAYNAERQYEGYYDARNNLTKDRNGAPIAKGNVASRLIFRRNP